MLAKTTIQPLPEIEIYKIKPKDDLMEIIKEKFSNIQLNTIEEEIIDNETYEAYDIYSINKFGKGRKQKTYGTYNTKYADRPRQRLYYYPRPTPQDVLHEEQEYEINNSYNGKAIYEWNLDGYTDRQVYMMTHRMMKYATIAKKNNNTDQTVCKMIAAGFTGQLKGWWDNYIDDKQNHIYEHIKQGDKQVSDALYTLILTIIEHFTRRWSDNSETIRTLLNGLRCPTLNSFRWYKDVF
ncbi:hypothetical protein HanPI659440_Chr15g0589831 [Helianthus annuus]|nr:hypothetical protein HanPI659440_Chr15g0589831 [Helianthus annuus]